MSADDLAERWQVPRSQVYRLAREGRVPAVWIGRYVRFRPLARAVDSDDLPDCF